MYEMEELLINLEEEKEQLAREKRCLQVSKYQKTKKKVDILLKQIEQLKLEAIDEKISSCRHYFIRKKQDDTQVVTCLRCGLTNEFQGDFKVAEVMRRNFQSLSSPIKIQEECTTIEQLEQLMKTYQEVCEQYPRVPIDLLEEEIKLRLKKRC